VSGTGGTIKLTRIQKLIGERMLESEQTKACFYIETAADVTELMVQRRRVSKATGVKITSNAFLIRALALAVRELPLAAGTLDADGDNIKIAERINVGFALNTAQGLLMPVIKDADQKPLAQIAELEKSLTERARSNKLTLEDMQGPTTALTNLGAYGIDSFIAIMPPQTSTILAVGSVVETVAAVGGEPAVRKMMNLTLSADGRIITGPYAAQFLGLIREQLENPQRLV
jgi:pyruvate dehydrogenase E2 component (dihydrolipoamide acetyltransferase)